MNILVVENVAIFICLDDAGATGPKYRSKRYASGGEDERDWIVETKDYKILEKIVKRLRYYKMVW